MNHTKNWTAWLGAGAVVLAGVAGCGSSSDQADPAAADRNRAQAASNEAGGVANAVDNAGEAASNMAGAAGNHLGNGANAVANAASGAGNAVAGAADAAVITPKIKTALGAAPALRGSNINVDTLPGNRVALRGSVRSAQQKALAERIAKQNAPGMTIVNQLTVGR